MQITMVPVKSSNMTAIGYKPNVNREENPNHYGTLRIEFTHGTVYDYKNVQSTVYKRFLEAESKGKFFHSDIKNKYQTIRLDE